MAAATTTTAEQRRRVPVVVKAKTQHSTSNEEEARKEELRRFVREKWKRIRELESQSSPGVSTEGDEEGSPSKASAIKESERRGSRASSVEYDPENPFDDEKRRVQSNSETSKIVCAPIRKEASASFASSSSQSQSSLRHKDASQSDSRARLKSKTGLEKQATKAVRTDRAGGLKQHPAPSTSDAMRRERVNIKANIAGRTTTEKFSDGMIRQKSSSKTVASSEGVITKPHQAEKTLKVNAEGSTERTFINPTSLPVEESVTNTHMATERDPESTRQEKDTPTRRKKRRSEVPHYQPAAVVSLSADTSTALAELEASLARLKAHSGKASSARRNKARSSPSPSPNHRQDDEMDKESAVEKARSRRSLSPAKEMRQMQLELEKTQKEHGSSPPRVSFLQRIEQKREEALSHVGPLANELAADNGVLKEQENRIEPNKKKVTKRYSYTPTQRQPEPGTVGRGDGLDDESSCSIVIGEESIDDMIRHRKSSRFLSSVRVFVDVRDQDGEDASSGWIEKLKSVGARVYSKIPSSSSSSLTSDRSSSEKGKPGKLTHIVYKNGRPSTLHYLRAMSNNSQNGPTPPVVVGVNWILESLQQGVKVDEKGFLVEVGKQAIFNKPRNSMTSKRAPPILNNRSSPHNMAELLAKKKTIQNAPAQPSPLAKRCWNMDASISSVTSVATSHTQTDC